jgi:hypothetical protein
MTAKRMAVEQKTRTWQLPYAVDVGVMANICSYLHVEELVSMMGVKTFRLLFGCNDQGQLPDRLWMPTLASVRSTDKWMTMIAKMRHGVQRMDLTYYAKDTVRFPFCTDVPSAAGQAKFPRLTSLIVRGVWMIDGTSPKGQLNWTSYLQDMPNLTTLVIERAEKYMTGVVWPFDVDAKLLPKRAWQVVQCQGAFQPSIQTARWMANPALRVFDFNTHNYVPYFPSANSMPRPWTLSELDDWIGQ